jgi:hypothetical protein
MNLAPDRVDRLFAAMDTAALQRARWAYGVDLHDAIERRHGDGAAFCRDRLARIDRILADRADTGDA